MEIKLNSSNPRKIDKDKLEKLKKSIKDFPKMLELRPIVVDKDGIILGGNMRFKALQELSIEVKDEWIKVADKLTPEEIRRFIVEDNLSFGDWNFDELSTQYDTDELLAWGFDEKELQIEKEVEEDEAPEVDETVEPISKLGEVYQLGRHRLMCGDSTKIEDVEKLMDGQKADMVFTDPPYGMNAVSGSGVLKKKYKTDILGDDNVDVALKSFELCQSLDIEKQVWWGANYYSEILPNSECWIVWDKNNGDSDQTDCELAWTNFRSVIRQFTQSSEKINRVHPTQKPVSLPIWTFKKFNCGNIVLDLFGGSGSTLIACEQTNRNCYMMELDPKYIDVIRKRYAKFIGKEEEWQKITPLI